MKHTSLFSFPNSVSHPAKQIKYLKALGAFVILVLVFVHFHVTQERELKQGDAETESPILTRKLFRV